MELDVRTASTCTPQGARLRDLRFPMTAQTGNSSLSGQATTLPSQACRCDALTGKWHWPRHLAMIPARGERMDGWRRRFRNLNGQGPAPRTVRTHLVAFAQETPADVRVQVWSGGCRSAVECRLTPTVHCLLFPLKLMRLKGHSVQPLAWPFPSPKKRRGRCAEAFSGEHGHPPHRIHPSTIVSVLRISVAVRTPCHDPHPC